MIRHNHRKTRTTTFCIAEPLKIRARQNFELGFGERKRGTSREDGKIQSEKIERVWFGREMMQVRASVEGCLQPP
jgi:hypothetical protein